ncbi:alpha/beta fold hydrolase [Lentzea jiangxiensis]|uniref:Pimeloyl-ACP methyl ester carboxylesterase n=1 Tax=Lentzea jiangxiensis TaxID=641025 RepID=A0A1H0X3H8_9PSEU|nr:alpha/beta hydrolase [Lentzea jiangxiensis]SDP97517.1 Pimeloyl-ACP methyl ester carboxylesterase [Lentzea jiangxiensis]
MTIHENLRTITDDGVALHVEAQEAEPGAPTIVFVTGVNTTLRFWRRQRRELTGRARMVFYDHRGHGGSSETRPAAATIVQLARDLHVVLTTAAPDEQVILVGHSMGGMVITALAEQLGEKFHDLVRSVVLINSVPNGLAQHWMRLSEVSARRTVALIRKVLPAARRTSRALTPLFRRAGLAKFLPEVPTEVTEAFMAAASFADHRPGLERFHDRNTLVIAGERDNWVPLAATTAMARTIRGATLLVIPEGGHLTPVRNPELVSAHLTSYLDGVIADRT